MRPGSYLLALLRHLRNLFLGTQLTTPSRLRSLKPLDSPQSARICRRFHSPDPKVHRVAKEHKVVKVHKAHKDARVSPERRVFRVAKASKVTKVFKETKVVKVHKVSKVCREPKEPLVTKVWMALKA